MRPPCDVPYLRPRLTPSLPPCWKPPLRVSGMWVLPLSLTHPLPPGLAPAWDRPLHHQANWLGCAGPGRRQKMMLAAAGVHVSPATHCDLLACRIRVTSTKTHTWPLSAAANAAMSRRSLEASLFSVAFTHEPSLAWVGKRVEHLRLFTRNKSQKKSYFPALVGLQKLLQKLVSDFGSNPKTITIGVKNIDRGETSSLELG